MRLTPIPLLRDLAPCVVISRCKLCGELVHEGERCESSNEASACPSRDDIDGGEQEVKEDLENHEAKAAE